MKHPKFDTSQFSPMQLKPSVHLLPPSFSKIETTYEMSTYDSCIIEGQVDIRLAKFHSQHFIPLVTTNSTSYVTADKSSFSLFLGGSVSDKVYMMKKMPSRRFFTMEYPRGLAQATMEPLHCPSSIIAPDGKLGNIFGTVLYILNYYLFLFL